MAVIKLESGSTVGAGKFIRVLRDNGKRIGRIYYRDGVYRFHAREGENFGGVRLEHTDLEKLMTAIRMRYL
jgi:hypothetical protein